MWKIYESQCSIILGRRVVCDEIREISRGLILKIVSYKMSLDLPLRVLGMQWEVLRMGTMGSDLFSGNISVTEI